MSPLSDPVSPRERSASPPPRSRFGTACAFLPGVTVLALVFWTCRMVSDSEVAGVLAEWRGAAIPLYFLAVLLSIVVSPFGGPISLIAVGVQVLGFPLAFPTYLVARFAGTTAAFAIGRRYGDRIVRKLVGERGLALVHRLTRVVQPSTLVPLRLFDGNLSDYVSYAAGLQRIGWFDYLWKTNVLPIPFLVGVGWMLRHTGGDLGALTGAMVGATLASVLATVVVYRVFGLQPARAPLAAPVSPTAVSPTAVSRTAVPAGTASAAARDRGVRA